MLLPLTPISRVPPLRQWRDHPFSLRVERRVDRQHARPHHQGKFRDIPGHDQYSTITLVHLLGLEPRMPFGRQVLNLVGLPISLEVQVRVFKPTPSGRLAHSPTLRQIGLS